MGPQALAGYNMLFERRVSRNVSNPYPEHLYACVVPMLGTWYGLEAEDSTLVTVSNCCCGRIEATLRVTVATPSCYAFPVFTREQSNIKRALKRGGFKMERKHSVSVVSGLCGAAFLFGLASTASAHNGEQEGKPLGPLVWVDKDGKTIRKAVIT